MKFKIKYIYHFLWLLLFLFGLNNHVFERQFYFNEILSLAGFVIFLYFLIANKKKNESIFPKSQIFKYVLFFIGLCVVHLIVSIPQKTSWYFYFRNSVIFYSSFAFFFGFYGFKYLTEFLKGIRIPLGLYLLYALIFPSIYLLERFMGAAFFPLLFKKYNKYSLLGIVILTGLLIYSYESLTAVAVSLIVLFLVVNNSYKLLKVGTFTTLIFAVIVFAYLKPHLEKYTTPPYLLFGNIEKVSEDSKLLQIDENTTWRAVFWYRVTVERFPENLLGIGFGTPMLAYRKGYDTVPVANDDEHDIHVSGAHNTYLTLTLRLGVLFLLIICLIFRKVFKFFYAKKKYLMEENEFLYFYSFFTVAAIGLFNLILETPTGASMFWGFLGVIAAIIYKKEKQDLIE